MGRPPKKPKLSDEEIAALIGSYRLKAKKRAIGLLKQCLITHETQDPSVVQDVIKAFKLKPGPDPPLQVEDTEENATNNSKSKTRYYSKKGNATRNRTINDEHNEVCEVCDRGGDLMCCDTCTLVFHMPCIRPKISSMPKGSWSCPYCIVDRSVEGDRSTARAAIKAMWNLELGLDSDDEAPQVPLRRPPGSKYGEEFDDDAELAEEMAFRDALRAKTVGEVTVAHSSTKKYIVRQTAKRQIIELGRHNSLPDALASLPDASGLLSSPSQDQDDVDAHSKKRNNMPSSSGMTTAGFSAASGSMSPSGYHHPNNHHSVTNSSNIIPLWCTQCIDSAHIQICIFCGCTKCGGKIDSELLIMCDHCNRVVHTYCHDPPLNAIPSANPWFCEGCRSLPNDVLYGVPSTAHDGEWGEDVLDGEEFGVDETGEDFQARRKQRSDSLVSAASTTASGASYEHVKRGRGRPPGSGKKQYTSVGSTQYASGGAATSSSVVGLQIPYPPPSSSAGANKVFTFSNAPSTSSTIALQMKPIISDYLTPQTLTTQYIPTASSQAGSKRISGVKRSGSAADLSSTAECPLDNNNTGEIVPNKTKDAESKAPETESSNMMDVDESGNAPIAVSDQSSTDETMANNNVFSLANGLAVIQQMSSRILRKDETEWLSFFREYGHKKDMEKALSALFEQRDVLLRQLKETDPSAYEDMLRVYGPVNSSHDASLLAGEAKLLQAQALQQYPSLANHQLGKDDNSSVASSSINYVAGLSTTTSVKKEKKKQQRSSKKAAASATSTTTPSLSVNHDLPLGDDHDFVFGGDDALYAAFPLQRDLSLDSGAFSLSFEDSPTHGAYPSSSSHPPNMSLVGNEQVKQPPLSRSSSQTSGGSGNMRLSALLFPSESPMPPSIHNPNNLHPNSVYTTTHPSAPFPTPHAHVPHNNNNPSIRGNSHSDDMLFALSASPLSNNNYSIPSNTTGQTYNHLHPNAYSTGTGSLPSPPRLLPSTSLTHNNSSFPSTGSMSNNTTSLPTSSTSVASTTTVAPVTLTGTTSALSSLASSVTIMPSGTIVLTDIPLRHHLQPHQQQQFHHLQQSLTQTVLAQQQTSTLLQQPPPPQHSPLTINTHNITTSTSSGPPSNSTN